LAPPFSKERWQKYYNPNYLPTRLCDGYHNLPVEIGGKIVYNKGSSRKGGKMKKQLKGEKNDEKKNEK
jgi:hypothetical protein